MKLCTGSVKDNNEWFVLGGTESIKGCKSQLLLLGKFEYGGGPIFKVVLEC